MVTGLDTAPIVGRLFGFFLNLLSSNRREIERERPEVLLKVRFKDNPSAKWRSANFSVTNQPNQQLVATQITLGWGSWGVRIAPAIVEGNNWHMDASRAKGRTFLIDTILRGASPRQNVPFYVYHPDDANGGGRHWIKVWILLEHRHDSSRRWWTGIAAQLPQQAGDDVLFNRRGPHR